MGVVISISSNKYFPNSLDEDLVEHTLYFTPQEDAKFNASSSSSLHPAIQNSRNKRRVGTETLCEPHLILVLLFLFGESALCGILMPAFALSLSLFYVGISDALSRQGHA